jgi:hypothetical protein
VGRSQWLAYNQTCPSCREPLATGDLKRDRNIESIVNDLEVWHAGPGFARIQLQFEFGKTGDPHFPLNFQAGGKSRIYIYAVIVIARC